MSSTAPSRASICVNPLRFAPACSRLIISGCTSIAQTLPPGMKLEQSYDLSIFIEESLREVWRTLGIAVLLVIVIIFLFLGSLRAVLVPMVAVPVSVMATFLALDALGFSINTLTMLALVLAIGLVVDDAIVVLENIHRRIEGGENPMVAAFRGTRQVGFAVVATTVVLLAVFVLGRLTPKLKVRLWRPSALRATSVTCWELAS
jgi:multidrug efflux pump